MRARGLQVSPEASDGSTGSLAHPLPVPVAEVSLLDLVQTLAACLLLLPTARATPALGSGAPTAGSPVTGEDPSVQQG